MKPHGQIKYLGAFPVNIPLSNLFKSQLLSNHNLSTSWFDWYVAAAFGA